MKNILLHTDFPAPNWDQTTVVGNGHSGMSVYGIVSAHIPQTSYVCGQIFPYRLSRSLFSVFVDDLDAGEGTTAVPLGLEYYTVGALFFVFGCYLVCLLGKIGSDFKHFKKISFLKL